MKYKYYGYSGQHNYTFDDVAATSDNQTFSITDEQVATGYVEVVSTAYMNIYSVVAVLAYKPQEIVAKWTFDTGYDVSELEYTPNGEEWSEIAQTQSKNNTAKKFFANNGFKSLNNYIATVSNDNTGGTYYSIKLNNGDNIFSLNNNGTTNSISDYTESSSHTVYYEFSFPTNGLNDIKLEVQFTDNTGGNPLELVYSTDNGTTWTDGGSCTGGTNWYTYSTTSKSLLADNKNKVIVRLLPANGEQHDYRINYLTITGKRAITSVNVSSAKYATYYNSLPVELPAGLEAATIENETNGILDINYCYGEGDIIPGGTPVLLKAETAGDFTLIYAVDNTDPAPAGNLLYGSDTETTTTGGGAGAKYYALQNGANGLGFYWMVADGDAFTSGAHKAWLALPAATLAPFFTLDGGETTFISEELRMKSEESAAATEWYTLDGRRVQPSNLKKGLYIVNGRKVVIK